MLIGLITERDAPENGLRRDATATLRPIILQDLRASVPADPVPRA